jgi:hypothetical protein
MRSWPLDVGERVQRVGRQFLHHQTKTEASDEPPGSSARHHGQMGPAKNRAQIWLCRRRRQRNRMKSLRFPSVTGTVAVCGWPSRSTRGMRIPVSWTLLLGVEHPPDGVEPVRGDAGADGGPGKDVRYVACPAVMVELGWHAGLD